MKEELGIGTDLMFKVDGATVIFKAKNPDREMLLQWLARTSRASGRYYGYLFT